MKNVKRFSVTAVFLLFLAALMVLMFLLPKSDFSENEKRVLADFPQITWESVTSGQFGKDFETYLADHFPMRDLFFGINAYYQLATGRNGASGIYFCDDGYLIATPDAYDSGRLQRNVQQFAAFAESAGLPATIMAVPNPGYILEEKLPENHLQYPDDAIMDTVNENSGTMRVVDLRSAFLNSQDDLYYRTDHHLTSAGSYEMYRQLCQSKGMDAKTFTCGNTYEGFYGTGYSKSGLWLTQPDKLEIWESGEKQDYTVTIFEGAQKQESDSLYFTDHLERMDQYPVFLDGNHALVTIENKSVSNGKRLLLIKDSYAHCFATFAAADYEMICMVDLRYYREKTSELIETYDLNEILYLYGVGNLATSTDIAWLQ